MTRPARSSSTEATVLWWIGWISLTILTFFASAWFWTGVIAKHYGAMSRPLAPALWTAAVFGTWMIILVPLIIMMYNRVDKAYEDARMARESAAAARARQNSPVRVVRVADSRKQLPPQVVKKIKGMPETLKMGYFLKGHLVTAVLSGGRRVDHVFVVHHDEIAGVYGLESFDFDASDVTDAIAADLDRLPAFDPARWLRIEGEGE